MASHYVLAPATGRNFLHPGFTPASFKQRRWKECTSVLYAALNFVFPSLQQLNKRLEKRIEDEKRNIPTPQGAALADVEDALKFGATNFVATAAGDATVTFFVAQLAAKGTPLALSMAQQTDSYFRLLGHYTGKLLDAMYLPARLAKLFFPAVMSETEVKSFEEPNLSAIAIAQDSLKRQAVLAVGQSVNQSVRAVIMWWRTPAAAKQPRVTIVIAGVWVRAAVSWVTGSIGAVIFRPLGPGWELLGEMLGATVGQLVTSKKLPWTAATFA